MTQEPTGNDRYSWQRTDLSNTSRAKWIPEIGKVALHREHVPDDGRDTVYLTAEDYDKIGEIFEKASDTDTPMGSAPKS
jgi:hypothetical protein